jgi:hypothetical protein
MSNYNDAMGTLSKAFTEADAMVGVGWAVLAVADELRAARKPVEVESESKYVYVIRRTLPGGRATSVAVYTSEDKARKEVQNLSIMAVKQDVDVDWTYEALILNKGE